MRVIVCGAGAIGTSTAYFLSRLGAEVTVVERSGVACAASGKSGGFLALDWCDGTPLQELARRSFALHASLAAESAEDWGFRRLTTYGGLGRADGRMRRAASSPAEWVGAAITLDRRLGSTETTAQVHPALFTTAMMNGAEARGAKLVIGSVTGVVMGERGVEGVSVDGDMLEADAIVIAMGPWSLLAARWLPLPYVFGLKGHSLVFETKDSISPDALFLEFAEAGGSQSAPEVFPRADGTTYVCAISSESPVPADPAAVMPDPGAIERLEATCRDISPVFRDAKILARQACYRPVTADGLPLIGTIPGVPGAYVATGHSVWGILNAPATGEALAELIVAGTARHVDLSPFNPGRRLR